MGATKGEGSQKVPDTEYSKLLEAVPNWTALRSVIELSVSRLSAGI